MEEIWKDIPGYEGLYQVRNMGRVMSLKYRGWDIVKIQSPTKNRKDKNGYFRIHLWKDGERKKSVFVHVLIARTFLERKEGKIQVNHINGIKTDNRLENLEWVTPKENVRHAIKMGLMNPTAKHLIDYWKGRDNTGANNATSKKILQYSKEGVFIKEWGSMAEAGRELGILVSHICSCCKGTRKTTGGFTWKYKTNE